MKLSNFFLGVSLPRDTFSLPMTKKEIRGFPTDYKYMRTKWGQMYIKVFEKENFFDAVKLCQSDGGTLPVPKSGIGYDGSHNQYFS